mmetsp:Transcript_39314/g.77338  ORF Transcript_39314/g.77338 Transcript_39314/m.77338 type:complete len:84 (-) Transcript_39314:222-473(-)
MPRSEGERVRQGAKPTTREERSRPLNRTAVEARRGVRSIPTSCMLSVSRFPGQSTLSALLAGTFSFLLSFSSHLSRTQPGSFT